jgi:DNA-binding NarL/FixJ family response regulator
MAMSEIDGTALGDPTRVVVAHRHEGTRSGTRAAVEGAGLVVVSECGDAASATAATVRERAHLCLVDANLPGGAIEAVSAIVSLPLAPRVVVLASSPDVCAFAAALLAGASGYLLEDVAPARLAEDLREVAEGGTVLAPALAARLVENGRRRGRRRSSAPVGLTDREWEVLQLLARGLSTKQIALRLRLSSTTARRHVASAVERIGGTGSMNGKADQPKEKQP